MLNSRLYVTTMYLLVVQSLKETSRSCKS